MEQTPEVHVATSGSSGRLDTILRWLVVVGVAVVLGLAGLLGYSMWQVRNAESLSTPAGRAIQDLKNRVAATPNDAPLRVRLGEALASAGLIDGAVEQFKTAVKLDQKHTGAYLDLGIMAMQEKQRKTAEGYFNKVVELTTGSQFEDINQRRETAFFYLGEIALGRATLRGRGRQLQSGPPYSQRRSRYVLPACPGPSRHGA